MDYYYRRMEFSKRELQRKVCDRLGVVISDPEVLVGLLADELIPQYDYNVEIYEEYPEDDADGDTRIVIEGFCRKRRN